MTEHTPTPWLYAPTGNMATEYSQPFAVAAPPNLIAGCFGDTPGGIAEAEANAAFIVKAVNCHDALVAALKASQNAIHKLREDGVLGTCWSVIERDNLAALAKAQQP